MRNLDAKCGTHVGSASAFTPRSTDVKTMCLTPDKAAASMKGNACSSSVGGLVVKGVGGARAVIRKAASSGWPWVRSLTWAKMEEEDMAVSP